MSTLTRSVAVAAALLAIALILWIDVATRLWQDLVVISGIAAGLLTFVLTVLVIDRVIARSTHERWAPVTRLALGDILYALTDQDATRASEGDVVPRFLGELPSANVEEPGGVALTTTVDGLVLDVNAERRALSVSLGTWSTFLASSADVDSVVDAAAEIAERLDLIRGELDRLRSAIGISDGREDVDAGGEVASLTDALNQEIGAYNEAADRLIRAIETTISLHRAQRGSSLRAH